MQLLCIERGFPGGSDSKFTCSVRDLGLISGSGRSPGEEDPLEWQPTPVFLPGEFHGQRSLVGYSPWRNGESERTEQLSLSIRAHSYVLRTLSTS